jgi:hypothetical protein
VGVYRLLAGAAGFLAPIGPSDTIFAAIDIAARPGVPFHHGLGGKFNAGNGNSARSEKANSFYPSPLIHAPSEELLL